MKSIKSLMLVLAFSMTLLAGCGSDKDDAPVVEVTPPPSRDASVQTAVKVVDKMEDTVE